MTQSRKISLHRTRYQHLRVCVEEITRIRGFGTDRRDRRDRRDRKGSEGSLPIVRDRKRSEGSEKLKNGRVLADNWKLGIWEFGIWKFEI